MNIESLQRGKIIRYNRAQYLAPYLMLLFFLLGPLLAACDTTSTTRPNNNTTLPSNNGSITYSTGSTDVLIRTFYGGGNLGTLDYSPVISIYGDGTFILGPGLQMRSGKLNTESLQQLLHTLVDTNALLTLNPRQFYDVPDQNATILELSLNNKHYEYVYGPFGALQESSQDMNGYHRLEHALAAITGAIKGPTQPYVSESMMLLVHQDFSPDLTQNIPSWTLKDFSLYQLAAYECGVTPPDETGPNGDTGCLTFTKPHYAYLPTDRQLQTIKTLLHGAQEGDFFENDLYYHVILRPLLPDELPQKTVAMLGSQEFTYTGVPLYSGRVPQPTPLP
ncbi:MAG: hypothetical protein ACJ788_23580 [Ktedonobacteraceae bacterium]|jgi:hypothetical protein